MVSEIIHNIGGIHLNIVTQQAIEHFRGLKGALIPVLHAIQEGLGYLPEEELNAVSAELNIPLTEIYGVATFYSFFSLEPKGEKPIHVCLGTACYIKGSQDLLDRFEKELGIRVGETTEDGKFSLDATRCVGACGLAPIATVGEKVYPRFTVEEVAGLLSEHKNEVKTK